VRYAAACDLTLYSRRLREQGGPTIGTDGLRAVIEEFVTRDTTDYGERARALEEKVEDVMRQLRRGQAQVVFDPETGTVNIVLARER